MPVELVITQSSKQVKIRLTSQLINGISRVHQKLLNPSSDRFSIPSQYLFFGLF